MDERPEIYPTEDIAEFMAERNLQWEEENEMNDALMEDDAGDEDEEEGEEAEE